MRYALKLAKYAALIGEVPVGAILIKYNLIISKGWNACITLNDPTAHAEIITLRKAAKKLKNYRLLNATLYVTQEPCIMCTGAILHSRIKRVVFGSYDKKYGLSKFIKEKMTSCLNHKINFSGNILGLTCSNLMSNFFRQRRKKKIGNFRKKIF